MLRAIFLLTLLSASSAIAQEKQKIGDLQLKVIDLVFRVTDLSGNLIDVGGKIEDMRVNETSTEMTIDLAADVLFEFDSAEIRPVAEETLQKAATLVRERARGNGRIEGHTDAKGDDAYNLRLSQKRAEAVRDWFLRQGVNNVQFSVEGFGEKKPVAANTTLDGVDDPAGRRKNRRVQIVVRKG